jgi:ATP synthase protein I
MNDTTRGEVKETQETWEECCERVGAKEARKIRARREKDRRIWFGLGKMGLIGWSVAVPTVIGIALGIWLDMQWPSRVPWTLVLLLAGVALGCLNAWYWIAQESRRID